MATWFVVFFNEKTARVPESFAGVPGREAGRQVTGPTQATHPSLNHGNATLGSEQ